ncbi:hypothetical protein BGX28_005633 [Mortierella sp. GBA30]|nr:hypothetical protein BGX28_005633 [Mortierella sp. GBA30]
MEVVQSPAQQSATTGDSPAGPKSSDVKAPVLAMTFPHVHGHSASATGIPPQDATATSDTSITSTTAGTMPAASFSKHPVLVKEGSLDMSLAHSLSQESNSSSRQSVASSESLVKPEDDQEQDSDIRRKERQKSNEQMIEHVLQQGKILKVSRRLRTRLEYAILKIRRGWSKYTLQEVESLIQPSMSPRLNPNKRPLSLSVSTSTSPRQSERKRVRKEYPEYEHLPTSRRQTSPTEAAASRRYRARPSFSQFKDSELFLPAKSLMDIATSSPPPSPGIGSTGSSLYAHHHRHQHHRHHQQYGAHSPIGYGSPSPLYGSSETPISNWSSYSLPTSPVMSSSSLMQDTEQDRDDGNGVPSDAQAARTILLLASSPTRPTPRTLDRSYLMNRDRLQDTSSSRSASASPIMHHADVPTVTAVPSSLLSAAPYSPMTSSPLVQFQTTAASTPSPDRSPSSSSMSNNSIEAEVMENDEEEDNPFIVKRSTKKPPKQTLANLYGTKYEPMAPSPLSTSTTTQSTLLSPLEDENPMKRIPTTHSSRESSPTLKQAARVAEKEAIIKSSDSTPDIQPQTLHQEHQEHYDGRNMQRAITPVKEESSTSKTIHASAPSTPPQQTQTAGDAAAGSMRTPPPSVGSKESIQGNNNNSPRSIAIAETIAARRRNSGLAGGPGVGVLTTVFPKPDHDQT